MNKISPEEREYAIFAVTRCFVGLSLNYVLHIIMNVVAVWGVWMPGVGGDVFAEIN